MNRRSFFQLAELAGAQLLSRPGAAQSPEPGKAAEAKISPESADFFVAPNGDDANAGTRAKPLRTLAGARDAVLRLRRRRKNKRPIVVLLRDGTYYLRRAVVFGSQDSGSPEGPVTYAAYPGETPVLSGGSRLIGWKVYKDQIYSLTLPREEDQYYAFRQLFFNGKRQIRSRWPNYNPQSPYYGGWAFMESTEPAESTAPLTFRWEAGVTPKRWAKPEQGEVITISGLAWLTEIMGIREVDYDNRLITVTKKLGERWNRLTKGNRFYVENLLEELDAPGEWCFDSDTNTVYFWPPEGAPDSAEVTIPITDRLIELRATGGSPVRHLRFYGLTFTQTLAVFPNPIPQRQDYLDCNRPNSGGYAFYMENTEHCEISNCRFDQVGGDAVRLHGYSRGNQIVDNEIVHAGAQGICMAYLNFWPYDFPPTWRRNESRLRAVSSMLPTAAGNVISRNHIHHCGVIDSFGAGIHLHGLNCDRNVISHNFIHDMTHHGIYLSMGFGRNLIEYNDLHTLCLVMADAGGVYSNRWCILDGDPVLGNNNIIRFNLIRDVRGVYPFAKPAPAGNPAASEERIRVPYFTWGIYFDNSPQRATVFGNITVGNVWGGVFLGGGYSEPQDCVVENNILIDSSVYQFDLGMKVHASGNVFRRNIVYFRSPDAALLRVRSPGGVRECDYNVYFHESSSQLKVAGVAEDSFDRWRQMGFDAHSVIADPLFENLHEGDYRLKPESPAFRLGFQPIPIERIGLRPFLKTAHLGPGTHKVLK
ncbi:MAG TPA: right-handed parallel beta-helix repeat-containing protein [Bryobacteraceae bacterium]|nr:right-handed parallel beta-helix repeat-containing protein [Bryobacteraceae bacterium]